MGSNAEFLIGGWALFIALAAPAIFLAILIQLVAFFKLKPKGAVRFKAIGAMFFSVLFIPGFGAQFVNNVSSPMGARMPFFIVALIFVPLVLHSIYKSQD